jgi:two-component system NtrC family sensor kinase
MVLVGGLLFYEYDWRYRSLVHETAVLHVEEADAALNRARLVSLAGVLLALGYITYKSVSLSRRMAGRISQTDTEKQRLNEQMFQTAKLASIGELASGVAHEINNPLAVMIEEAGWIQDLLEEEDLKKAENYNEFKRSLEQIQVQGKRCKDITRNLLSFARREDADTSNARIDLLLEDLFSVIERRSAKRGVQFTADVDKDLPLVRISMSELQQVLFNLINNALDAMDPDGGRLRVSAKREGEEIILDVVDTGSGISSDELGRVFDPFYTTKPVGQGTGLGLSICYGLVRKWGGRIRIESTPGKGTRVWFTIPLDAEDENEPARSEMRTGATPNEGLDV